MWLREEAWVLFGKHSGWLSYKPGCRCPIRGVGLVRWPSGLLCLLALQGAPKAFLSPALRHLSPLPVLLEAMLPSVHPVALVGELCILLAWPRPPPPSMTPRVTGSCW